MPKVKFTTTIDKQLWEDLKVVAIREGKHANEIIQMLVEKYLNEKKHSTK